MLLLFLLGSVFVTSCKKTEPSLPYYNSADLTPLWPNETAINIDTLHTIAYFSLTDQTGATISDKSFSNKVYVANFFFTCCSGICPTMSANLVNVAKKFRDNNEVLFVSFSVMPEADSVAKLKEYAKAYSIDASQWHLLTGDKQAIYHLARNSYFAEAEPGLNKDSSAFLHTEHLLLIDRNGHIRGVYNGTLPLDAERLTADIRSLLSES